MLRKKKKEEYSRRGRMKGRKSEGETNHEDDGL